MRPTAVLVPSRSGLKRHAFAQLLHTLQHEIGHLVLELHGTSQIDIARSFMLTAALAYPVDVFVFIDDDMDFDPRDVERLADVARETGGVVGAPYSVRSPGGPIVGGFDAVDTVGFFEQGAVYPAAGVIGMGFTAIARAALERLDALPEYAERRCAEGLVRPYFQKHVVDGFWLQEDHSFCHAVRQAGGRTDLDTRIRVKHVGEYGYGIEDCRAPRLDSPGFTLRLRAR